jgi:hypothetical protein
LVTLHVNINQITLSEVVHATLEQVVLDETLLHQHAVVSVHFVVGVVCKVVFFLAELDGFADTEYQVTFFFSVLAHFQ